PPVPLRANGRIQARSLIDCPPFPERPRRDTVSPQRGRLSMRRVNFAVVMATLGLGVFAGPALADVTAYENVRLIIGNGSVVENATLVIDGAKIVQTGTGVQVPA